MYKTLRQGMLDRLLSNFSKQRVSPQCRSCQILWFAHIHSVCICVCVCVPDTAPVCGIAEPCHPLPQCGEMLFTATLFYLPCSSGSMSIQVGQQAALKPQCCGLCECACTHGSQHNVCAHSVVCVCVCRCMILHQPSVSKSRDIAAGELSLSNTPVTRLSASCCCFNRIRDATVAFSLCLCACLLHSENGRVIGQRRRER